ncbi:glutaredoxin domain-containing protein [Anaerocolumna sp.]|uniref:glutaredoxin domain-containing protein n=1 Tax=Anaerocolumna sp. TaxID=2041569 RepID=UPI0028ABC63B|nr:glutaredoxin domain-containing protein [Anaerocolumna sp.]
MRKRRIVFIIVCFVIAILLGENPKTVSAANVSFTFFYNNSCASCKEDEDIYRLFNRCFSVEEKEQMNYEILVYNVFQQAGKEVYEKYCKDYQRETTENEFPILAVNGQWITGYEEIEQYLKNDFKEEQEQSTAEYDNEEKHNSTSQQKSQLESSTDTSVLEQLTQNSRDKNIKNSDKYLLLFTTYSCEECEKVKEYLGEIDSSVTIEEYNIGAENAVEILQTLYACYGVEDRRQHVPTVFIGNQVLTGQEEIITALSLEDAFSKATYGTFLESVNQKAGNETVSKINYLTLFGSGLLAGFNPCGISMLLMLLSILLTAQSGVLRNGILYIVAKLITYFGIGVGTYFAVSAVFSDELKSITRIFTMVVAGIVLILAVLNFVDFRNVRRKQYGKIHMQLPVTLRTFNHHMIKKMGNVSEKFVPLLAFGLGIVISFGEFFCTGQIYMASILYMLRTHSKSMLQILSMFLVYVGAMMLPTIVVLLVIYKTRTTNAVSEFMLRRMDFIKLFNAILFFTFFIYLLASLR